MMNCEAVRQVDPDQEASRRSGLFLGSQIPLSLHRGDFQCTATTILSPSISTTGSYDLLDTDCEEEIEQLSPLTTIGSKSLPSPSLSLRLPLPLHRYISRPKTHSQNAPAPDPASVLRFPSEPVLRIASVDRAALQHPTPDLQVLRGPYTGAYTGNIEHLERTAERLSMTSSIENAIKELHDKQKRADSRRSSLSSSCDILAKSRKTSTNGSVVEVNQVARSGGYSPGGYINSLKTSFAAAPTPRTMSSSKSSKFQRPDSEVEGRSLDSSISPNKLFPGQHESSEMHTTPRIDGHLPLESLSMDDVLRGAKSEEDCNEEQQPVISSSEMMEKMFADFDGIHNELQVDDADIPHMFSHRRMASGASMLSIGPRQQPYADPNTGQNMVYYPAPVPKMLNLPQKLSKHQPTQTRSKRKTQLFNPNPPMRQSGIWLSDALDHEGEPPDDEARLHLPQNRNITIGARPLSKLPPPLRASAYFELPSPTQVVELKDQSAVATLDSILDASAHAPVNAFIDHTVSGTLGPEAKARKQLRNTKSTTTLLQPPKMKKRISSFNLLRGRKASRSHDVNQADDDKGEADVSGVVKSTTRSPIDDDDDEESENDTTPLKHTEDAGELAVKMPEDEDSDEGQLDDEIYHGTPTTLLAELQIRKQRQKQRTQPLTKTFPNGIHSTLLELDTAIQTEQKTRRTGRTILAWEDPEALQAQVAQMEDDEDVPLAMLYTKKNAGSRPLGLMERRELEDNEPLSQRRNRLQGDRAPAIPHASTIINLSTPSEPDDSETLADRVKRLKVTSIPAPHTVSDDFASKILDQFGGNSNESKEKGNKKAVEVAPLGLEENETLSQRRKRLQAEREARAREVGGDNKQQQPPKPELKIKRSMADILSAHPSTAADLHQSYEKPIGGLLQRHEEAARRSASLLNFDTSQIPGGPGQRQSSNLLKKHALYNNSYGQASIPGFVSSGQAQHRSGGFNGGIYDDGQCGIVPPESGTTTNQFPSMFPQPSLGQAHGGGNGIFPASSCMGGVSLGMGITPNIPLHLQGYMQQMNAGMLQMGMGMRNQVQPLNQGQIDMVERWRQSVMQ